MSPGLAAKPAAGYFAMVVTLPQGQLGVYTPLASPLDPRGVFTRHIVWVPPTASSVQGRSQAVLRQGHAADIDWGRLWQRILASFPEPKDGYIFYGDDAHSTGSVPTHARQGHVVGVLDITMLLRVMDVTTSSWDGGLGIPHPSQKMREKWLKNAQDAFKTKPGRYKYIFEMIETAVKQFKNCIGAKSVGESTVSTTQDAYKKLQEAGWVPQPIDSAAVARLPVRAIVPARVTYSGKKTSQQQIDSLYRTPSPDGTSTSGGHYRLDPVTGDSIYTYTDYQGETPLRNVTIRPKR
ncbi:hypothetical protein LGH70_07435 [Hymenobacter sp. BT635]|uniref:Uncharacterized protein n=1 Tax=Hymenobacter nitidus TaxID=2880929 RepID=A0ABS8ABW1_9BACT|nr:hypothetical protein [Hymenobacter nitidus]MCB2377407.1 hypothetical protein [Hymenobacter nitidus]